MYSLDAMSQEYFHTSQICWEVRSAFIARNEDQAKIKKAGQEFLKYHALFLLVSDLMQAHA